MTTAPVVVQKFGGTSVSTPDARRQAVDHVREARASNRRVAVVVSAVGRRGDPYATDTLLDILRADGGMVDPADYDLMFVCGEIVSVALMSQTLKRAGIPARGLSAAQIRITTDGRHLESEVIDVETGRLQALMAEGVVPVICGGQGVAQNTLDFTTLGRGGSDTSGVVVGVALGAERVEIFTDVDGVMTSDPRLVPGARTLDRIGYRRCHEMARFGAKVVHPRALLAGWRAAIPIVVRSTFSGAPGTVIAELVDEAPIAGVALLHPMRSVSLGRARLAHAVTEEWERWALVLTVTDERSGELLVGAPAEKANDLDRLLAAEGLPVEGPAVDRAWVSVIGDPALLESRHSSAIAALSGIGCPIVAVERSGCRTTFVVAADVASRAVAALHRLHIG